MEGTTSHFRTTASQTYDQSQTVTFINHPLSNQTMGRIKTQLIKRLTKDIIKMSKPELGQEFEQNKKVVAELISGASKKIRNSVAGYATRLMKVKEEY